MAIPFAIPLAILNLSYSIMMNESTESDNSNEKIKDEIIKLLRESQEMFDDDKYTDEQYYHKMEKLYELLDLLNE